MVASKVQPLVWGFILFCLVSLIFGLGWLEIRLPGGFPLGTVATWLALVGFGWSLLRLAPRLTLRRQVAWLGLILALAWYPFSIYEAGNLALTFHGDSKPWVIWTAVVSVWLLVLGAWTVVASWMRRRGNN